MLFEPGHPLISLEDWRKFSSWQSPSLYFKKAIDREVIELPHWFVPLCPGVVIASPYLLRSFARKRSRPSGWVSLAADTYQRDVGNTRLRVRRTHDGRFWVILRWPPGVNLRSNKRAETIVHLFGSTPVLAASRYQAQQLAELVEAHGPVSSLRWTHVSPQWLIGALTFEIRRARSENRAVVWDRSWSSDARRLRSTPSGHRPPIPVDVRFALQAARTR
jgi:hypothetical protein